MPELPADKIEVKITAFITAAANAQPAFSNTKVNGDLAISSKFAPNNCGLVYGISKPITAMAKM